MNPERPFVSSPWQGDPPCSPAVPAHGCALDQRVQLLVGFYRHVQTERMQGIPILNPALCVEAVGFEWALSQAGAPQVAEGVLITPWFMSLVRLPAAHEAHGGRVGRSTVHGFGNERFDFIGAHDPAVGFHQTCALFSPMGSFRTQDLARETATQALALLRPAPPADAPATPPPLTPAAPSRRAFFTGQRARAPGAGA